MPITLPSGFQITSRDPIDSRITVANQAERLGFSGINVYSGLIVFQRDTNELYVLTDTGSWNQNSGWQLVGSGSGATIDTGSLMTTASAANNIITFTKGDGSTFAVTVDTGSGGGSIPSGTISSSAQISELGYVQSAITASSLETASANLNEITFTKGDGSTFAVTVDTGSGASIPSGTISSSAQITNLGFVQSAITASSLETASANLNEITFTKGDGSTFAITIDTGSGGGSIPSGTISSSAQISELGYINETQTGSMSVASSSVAVIATYTSEWTLGANGISDYTFTGPGLTGAENDPTIYLTRGQQYKFTNNMGQHPFRIQSTPNGSTGTPYNDGITNNDVSNGTLLWNVQFDSPDTLYYQCTAHTGMGGKIVIIDSGSSASIPSGTISSSAQITNLGFINETVTSSMSVATASYFGDGIITASSVSNTITFTKGDGTTFPISISTGSVEEASRAQSIQIDCRTSEAVSKGDPLYITGFDAGQNRPEVGKADASDSNKMPVVGLALEDAAINTNTRFVQAGQLANVNTDIDGASVNATLYVAVGGGFTTTRPTGSSNLVQNIGKIERVQQNNGEIIVSAILRTNDIPNIQPGYVWVGNNDGVATPTPTSSFSGAVPAGTISSSTQITNLGFINQTQTSSMTVATASYVAGANVDGQVASASLAETASYIPFNGNRAISNQYQPTGIYGENYGTNTLVDFIEQAYFANTPPVINSLVFDVNEYSAQGTTVGTISYTDPEGAVTFQTQSSYTADDFRVASNGVISVQTTLLTESLENDTSQGYDAVLFPVRGTDINGATVDKNLYIRIAGNSAPVFREGSLGGSILPTNFTASLSESSAAGAKPNATVYVTDANGDTLTLQSGSLPSTFINDFDLTISSDRFTITQTAANLDYDTTPTYDFVLTASDEHYQSGQDPSAITYLPYRIRVFDNATPTINDQQFNINENVNVSNGQGLISGEYRNVGQLTADGPEPGDVITYSNFTLQSLSIGGVNVPLNQYTGGGQSNPTPNAFTMDSTGYITRIPGVFVNSDLIDKYVYQVTVQDQYDPGTDTALIDIDIDDDVAPSINKNWGARAYVIESATNTTPDSVYTNTNGYSGTVARNTTTYNVQNETVSWNISSSGNLLTFNGTQQIQLAQNISGSYVDGALINFSVTASNTFGTSNSQAYTIEVTENQAPTVSYSDVSGGLTGSQTPGTTVGTITVIDSQSENITNLELSGPDAGSFVLGSNPPAGSSRTWNLNVGASDLQTGSYSLNGVGTDAYGKSTTQPISITIASAASTDTIYVYELSNANFGSSQFNWGIDSYNTGTTPKTATPATGYGSYLYELANGGLGNASVTFNVGGTNYTGNRIFENAGSSINEALRSGSSSPSIASNLSRPIGIFFPANSNLSFIPTSVQDFYDANSPASAAVLELGVGTTMINGTTTIIGAPDMWQFTTASPVNGYSTWYAIVATGATAVTGGLFNLGINPATSSGGVQP